MFHTSLPEESGEGTDLTIVVPLSLQFELIYQFLPKDKIEPRIANLSARPGDHRPFAQTRSEYVSNGSDTGLRHRTSLNAHKNPEFKPFQLSNGKLIQLTSIVCWDHHPTPVLHCSSSHRQLTTYFCSNSVIKRIPYRL